MADWLKFVESHFTELNVPKHDRVLNAGAAITKINDVGAGLGIAFPDEFVELYAMHDGIGHQNSDMTWWLTRPLDHLEEFATTICNWFRENHPELAERYIPFIDYGNGSAIGYLLNENSKAMPGLYHFNTGAYDFDDEDQEHEEFLRNDFQSIEHFFKC